MPLKRLICALLGSMSLLLAGSITKTYSQERHSIRTIVLDPGHGGTFHGANGSGFYTGEPYAREQDVTLQVALKLGKAIEKAFPDVKVIYTRTEDIQLADKLSADLRERINIANRARADLMIAIHCNSMGLRRVVTGYRRSSSGRKIPIYHTRTASPATKGVETFVAGSERIDEQVEAIGEYATLRDDYKVDDKISRGNPEDEIFLSLVNNDLRKKSILLASLLQDEYVATGRVNRGFKEQSLAVLRTATMPSILTEIGFISNIEEERYITSEEGQNEIVGCILRAIQIYSKQMEQN